MKKFIALTLSIVMLLSCMSLTVFAGKSPLVDELGDYITDEVAAMIEKELEEQRTKGMTSDQILEAELHDSITVSSDFEFDGAVYTIKEGSEGHIKIFSDFKDADEVVLKITDATEIKGIDYSGRKNFDGSRWINISKLNGAELFTVAKDAHSGLYPLTIEGTAFAWKNGEMVASTDVELRIQIVVACNHVNKGQTAVTLQKASLFAEGSQVIVCRGCGETLRVETVPAVLLDNNGFGLFMAISGIIQLLLNLLGIEIPAAAIPTE